MSAFVQRMTNDEFACLAPGSWQDALCATQVVIPAKDVADTIGETLRYLADLGFKPGQVHVLVNGCADQTAAAAEETRRATVHHMDDIFAANSELLEFALGRYGLTRERLRGKGSAMFAALLVLEDLELPPNTPVLFLDGDIKNLRVVDPASRLLAAWNAWKSNTVHIVKLASPGWDYPIRAFLGAEYAYRHLAALEWPLCGQMVVRWRELRSIRFATGYAVEIAMLMQLRNFHNRLTVFGEVEIATPLEDAYSSGYDLVSMYAVIMAFVRRYGSLPCTEFPGDRNSMPALELWLPSPTGSGQSVREERVVDAILPSIAELAHMR